MPKCKINGKEIEVKEGATIIEAFAKMEADIAHYCWHPGLSVAGVCRMCMVEVEGMPKLQIACNTKVTEGMVVNNQSEKVQEAVKWALDFHLINHPLDCPICDQAGECKLQEQYMRFGKYTPEMGLPKVKKHKVVPLGSKVMLDSERCILCSRCVRFTSEVSKTEELGIFNRGDRSEIGTFNNKPLENEYSLNTVDICPVGALTSREFRFQQRVWFLKEHQTVCTSCSTGCNVKVSYNKKGVFRVLPVANPQVNGYWMCDQGRDVQFVNKANRLTQALKISQGKEQLSVPEALQEVLQKIKSRIQKDGAEAVALVMTAQYTNEEIKALVTTFKGLGVSGLFYWVNNKENFDSFDGLLLRGDRNPNTKGLLQIFEEEKLEKTWQGLSAGLKEKKIKTVVVAGPENQKYYPDLNERVAEFSQAEDVIWLSSGPVKSLDAAKGVAYQIPLKTFFEKTGTFTNHNGQAQKIKAGPQQVESAVDLEQIAAYFRGTDIFAENDGLANPKARVFNELVTKRGLL